MNKRFAILSARTTLDTRQNLRLVAAMSNETIGAVLDRLIKAELDRMQKSHRSQEEAKRDHS